MLSVSSSVILTSQALTSFNKWFEIIFKTEHKKLYYERKSNARCLIILIELKIGVEQWSHLFLL